MLVFCIVTQLRQQLWVRHGLKGLTYARRGLCWTGQHPLGPALQRAAARTDSSSQLHSPASTRAPHWVRGRGGNSGIALSERQGPKIRYR